MAAKDLPIVTYSEDGHLWPTFSSEISGRMPLKSLDFTNPLRPEVHHIPQLEIEFKRFSPDMFPKFMPGAVQHNTFFLHLFIVSTEDMESYKSNSRKLIQDWLNIVGNKKNQEWMIIYCAEKTKGNRLFNMGATASVYEKLKTDFNLKKERFYHISGANNTDPKSAEVWNGLLVRIKELVFTSFASQIMQYEDDARRLEQQRLIPGWNYCQYFNLKEALSFTFEVLGMYEDVLVQYDELEATFFQTLVEQGAPWFKKFGGTESGDDNPDVFELTQKNYRDRIIQNSISIYDFRMYLFSRQVSLLNVLQKPIDILIRAKLFVSSFSRTIFDYRESLPSFFREIWTYSTTLNIIRHCDELLAICNYLSPLVLVYEGLKGELYLVSRYQLDRLGIAAKLISHSLHHDRIEIGDTEGETSFDITTPEKSKITSSNEQLMNSLKSKYEFDDAYETLSQKCFRCFEICKRQSSVMYLKADLALLYFTRQNYQKSADFFSQICFRYSELGWNHIDAMLIERYAICQRQLKNNNDLIQCYLHLVQFPDYLELETYNFYWEQLTLCCMNAPSVHTTINCTLFSLGSISVIDNLGPEESVGVNLQLFNAMTKGFEFESVSILFKGGEGMEMLFEISGVELVPGMSYTQLLCKRSRIPGEYSPTIVLMSRGKLHFSYDVPSAVQKSCKLRVDESESSVLFNALPVFGGIEELAVTFSISTRENHFSSNSILEIEALSNLILGAEQQILVSIGKAQHSLSLIVDEKDRKIKLPEIEPDTCIEFKLPVNLPRAAAFDHKIKISIYDEKRKCKHSSVLDLLMSLPVFIEDSVTHSAFKTLVIYKINGKENFQLRMVSFDFLNESKEPLKLEKLYPESNQLLFNNHVVSLAAILPSNASAASKLTLTVKYRHIHKEMEHFILSRLASLLKGFQVGQGFGRVKRVALKHFLSSASSSDLFYYGKTKVEPILWAKIEPLLANVPSEQQEKVQSALDKLNEELSLITEMQLRESTDILEPSCFTLTKIINPCTVLIRAKWGLPTPLLTIHVGDLLHCILDLEIIFWKLEADELTVNCNMTVDRTNFAFSGKSSMSFSVKKSQSVISFPYGLSPLKPGPLKLPVFQFTSKEADITGVYFEGPSEKVNRAVLPREESCRRRFPEE